MCAKSLPLVSVLIWTIAATLLAPVPNSAATVLQAPARAATVAIPPQPPPLVRFTGIIRAAEAKTIAHHTLNIFADGEEWQFILYDVKTLTYTTDPDWSILNDIFPRQLHFVGPDDLLRLWHRAEQTGTPVDVRGRLYRASRMFLVTNVEATEKVG